jgi:hypothetical protein
MRVSYEFFMRSVDLLGQLHENAISASIVMTLWHGQLARSGQGYRIWLLQTPVIPTGAERSEAQRRDLFC